MAVTVAIIGRLGFFFFFFVRFAEQRHLPSLLENVENIGKKFQNFSSKRLLISIFPHMLIQIFGLCFYVSSLFDYFIYFSRFNCPIVDLPPWIPKVLIVSVRLITREKRRLSRFRIIIDHTSPNQSIVQYLCNCFHLQFLIFQITIWIIETKLGENFYRNYILSKIWLRITVIIFINVIQCSCFNRIMIRVSLVSINRGSLNKRKSFVHLHVRNFIRTNFP